MNIGIISPWYTTANYGAGISTKLLCENLVKIGHKVTVYSFDGMKNSFEKMNGVFIRRFVQGRFFRGIGGHVIGLNLSTIQELMRTTQIREHDVLHAYTMWQIPSAAIIGDKYEIPTVATLNGCIAVCFKNDLFKHGGRCKGPRLLKCFECVAKSNLHFILLSSGRSVWGMYNGIRHATLDVLSNIWSRRFLARIDRFITYTESWKDLYSKYIHPNKIDVISWMYDTYFTNVSTCEHRSKDQIQILYVGSLMRSKGVELLLYSFKRILRMYPNGHLTLAGRRGPYEYAEEFMEIAKRLGIRGKVNFLGHVSYYRLPYIYQQADIYVNPSMWPESMQRTMFEAISCKIPIISSDNGSVSKLLDGCSITFKSGDVNDLTEKLSMLIEVQNLGRKLAEKAYNEILPKHSPEKVTHETIEVYNKTIANRTGP